MTSPPDRGRLAAVLATLAFLAASCASDPDESRSRWAGELDSAAAKALVAEAFASRASPNPHVEKGIPDRQVLSADAESVRFRDLSSPDAAPQIVWYRDITGVTRQSTQGIPSRPENVLVHLAPGSESARQATTRSGPLVQIGLEDPYIVLRERDARVARRLEEALAILVAGAPSAERSGASVEEFLEELERQEDQERRDRELRERSKRSVDSILDGE